MKKQLLLFLFAIVASVGTMFAWDYEYVQIGDLYYNLDATNQTAEVTSQNSGYPYWSTTITTANIPASVTYNGTTYSVTSIGDEAFHGCSSLTSVTIPNSVTIIKGYPFCDCSGLTSIEIPNSVTSIGSYAFLGCSSLPVIDNLRYADTYLVEAVDRTRSSYTIRNGTKWIGYRAFSWCSSLTSVTIPNSVTSIEESAFEGCSSLTSVTIPNSVTSIEESAFEGCSSLTSIEFPASLEYFDEGVINGCIGLVSIKIPSSVLSIGEYYGAECVNNGRNDCDEYYMYKNTIAGNVHVNSDSGLPYIHEGDRNQLPNLKTVDAPAWFFDVPEDGWAFCPKSLEKVIVNRGELNDNVFGVISRSYKTMKSLNVEAVSNTTLADEAFKDNYNLTELILPANLTSVSYMAVAGCKNLKAITIPASVEVIEASAFEDCRSIQSITFGGAAGAPGRAAAPAANSQLKKIGNWAFYNAHELQHLDIPEGVEEIGDGAFYGCTYLEDMVLPSSIRAIGDNCFALCGKLMKIVCNATTPPAIQAKTFYDVNRQTPAYVPDEAIASYESDEYWQEFDIQGASDLEDAVSYTTNDSAAVVTKVMRNGEVLILRGGKTYTLQGVEVK